MDSAPPRAFRVRFSTAAQDTVSTALWELGVFGIHELSQAPSETTWAVFLEDDSSGSRLRASLGPLLLAPIEIHDIPPADWVAEFRRHFRPFTVGSFRVTPAWEPGLQSGRRLVIDPGQAFGTGTHESTRLCLLALEGLAAVRSLGRTVDIGTGTGILALAALQLGARIVIGIDLDAGAVTNARTHARLNQCELPLVRGDGAAALRAGGSDTLIANVAAPFLRTRSSEIEPAVRAGGRLVLSGFLDEEADSLVTTYRSCDELGRMSEGGWTCSVLERRR